MNLGDLVVLVDAPDIKARIVAITTRMTGDTYLVVYFHDGVRREEWVYPCEVRSEGA